MPKAKPFRVFMSPWQRKTIEKDELSRKAMELFKTHAKRHGFTSARVMPKTFFGLHFKGKFGRKTSKFGLAMSRGGISKLATIYSIWPELGERIYDVILEHELRHKRIIINKGFAELLRDAKKKGTSYANFIDELLAQAPLLKSTGRYRRFYLSKKRYVENICLDLATKILFAVVYTKKGIAISKPPKSNFRSDLRFYLNEEYKFLKPEIKDEIVDKTLGLVDNFYNKASAIGIGPIPVKGRTIKIPRA